MGRKRMLRQNLCPQGKPGRALSRASEALNTADAASRPTYSRKILMMERQEAQIPARVMASDLHAKIKFSTYTLLPDNRTTICQITLENGFSVNGTSSCVSIAEYNQALGEKYAFEKAFEKIWELEGYLLRQKRYEAGLA